MDATIRGLVCYGLTLLACSLVPLGVLVGAAVVFAVLFGYPAVVLGIAGQVAGWAVGLLLLGIGVTVLCAVIVDRRMPERTES